MDALNFGFKLIKHGGIFLLRVGGIVLPAVAGSSLAACSRVESPADEKTEWDSHMDAMYDNTNLYFDER